MLLVHYFAARVVNLLFQFQSLLALQNCCVLGRSLVEGQDLVSKLVHARRCQYATNAPTIHSLVPLAVVCACVCVSERVCVEGACLCVRACVPACLLACVCACVCV